MTVTGGDENANVAFENCAPFTKWVIHINDEQIDTAENLDIIMAMYDLIEYGDNYSETSGGLWQFKRDESTWMILEIRSMFVHAIHDHVNINEAFQEN